MRLVGRNTPEWWAKSMGLDIKHHPKVGELAVYTGSFLSASLRNECKKTKWLVLEGGVGIGKTHASRWVVRAFNDWVWDFMQIQGQTKWRMDRKPSAIVVNWSKFCLREERDENEYTLNDYLASDLIVVDDVGAEADRFKSGAHISRLRDFLEDCKNKWLIVSTNVPASQWKKVFGMRVADRLDSAHHCVLNEIPSYRRKL